LLESQSPHLEALLQAPFARGSYVVQLARCPDFSDVIIDTAVDPTPGRWICMIEDGLKTLELRTYPMPAAYISSEEHVFVDLIACDPKRWGTVLVPCRVTFRRCVRLTPSEARARKDEHCVGNTMHDIWIREAELQNKPLWGWEIGVVIRYNEEERELLGQQLAGNRAQTWVCHP
jgi:hypothetical protein